jgi:heptosyltransferase-2
MPKKDIKPPRRILVIQLWGIGETILTLPAIRALRQRYRKANITILATTRNKDVYTGFKDINKAMVVDLGVIPILRFMLRYYKKFDLVIDMEEYLNISALISLFVGDGSIGFGRRARSLLYTKSVPYNDQQHVVETHMDLVRLVGAEMNVDRLIKLYVSKKDKDAVGKLLRRLKITDKDFLVGIAPGAAESSKSRMWSPERYAKLADELIDRYKAKIVFIGNKAEEELVRGIQFLMKHKSFNLAGRTSLKQAFYLIEKCKLFISNDSGPMHIAVAQGVKTIGLFGPNIPIRWYPYGEGNKSVYKPIKCSPCINVHKGQVPECRYGKNNRCMQLIKVSDVLEAVKEVIK